MGFIAKHGYTVDWGFFNGVCCGAERLPLEQDATFTNSIINDLRNVVAPKADRLAAELRAGTVEPQWFKRVLNVPRVFGAGKYSDVECTRTELDDASAAQQVANAAYKAEGNAANARSHANMLEKLIVARHGQPLMPISTRTELAVGDRVNRGNAKKPDLREVVAIEYRRCTGCGPYMNGKSMLHAILKAPSGATYAVPTRSIRQASIVKGGAQ